MEEENNKEKIIQEDLEKKSETIKESRVRNIENKRPEIDLKEILEEPLKEPSKKRITGSTIEEVENEFVKKEENAESLVEAVLFVAGRFLNIQELILLTDLNQIIIKEIIKKLKKKYTKGVLRIVERNNSFKMDVANEFHYLINRLASGKAEFTKAEQETLAVIAYKQPVKQSIIIKIRGNKSYDHIKKFRELGLVVGKPVGHTLILSLSEEFYEYFNVHQKEKN